MIEREMRYERESRDAQAREMRLREVELERERVAEARRLEEEMQRELRAQAVVPRAPCLFSNA